MALILDTEKLLTDGAYRDEQRFRFETDHFFAAEAMGFMQFNRKLHGPAVALHFPKNRNLPIEEQDPIKFRMHLDPRHTFKSSLGLVDTAQAIAALSKNLTILYETATQPLASSMMEVTVAHFGRGVLPYLYPEIKFKKRTREDCYDAETREVLSLDPTVGYTSPKSTQAGWHPWWMNADDVVESLNSGVMAPDDSRQRIIDLHDTNKNLLRRGGYLFIRGTRYHPGDMYGHELEKMNPDKWKVLIRASLRVKSGERLLPGEFPDEEDLELNFSELPSMDYESLRDMFVANYETFMCQQQNDPMGGAVPKFDEKSFNASQIDPDRLPPIGDTFLYWRPPYGGKPSMELYDEGAMVRVNNGRVYVLDAWKGIYGPTSRAEKIVKAVKEHDAEGVVIESVPGSDYMGVDIRNEALRRNVSVRVHWSEFEMDDNRREARILRADAVMRSGRLLFVQHMKQAAECRKQILHFGLQKENGIIDCISRALDRVPYSIMRANMTEEELNYQRDRREEAQFNAIFNQMGIPAVTEQQKEKALAHVLAMEAVSQSGLPKLPGGLDG